MIFFFRYSAWCAFCRIRYNQLAALLLTGLQNPFFHILLKLSKSRSNCVPYIVSWSPLPLLHFGQPHSCLEPLQYNHFTKEENDVLKDKIKHLGKLLATELKACNIYPVEVIFKGKEEGRVLVCNLTI